jgi:ribosomal protein L40E
LLTERDFRLIVDREAVKPRRACVWDETRYVVRNRERIPAAIRIDERLAPRVACLSCGAWQGLSDETRCSTCHSANLRSEERRIRGWVGIQRYLHTKDYGIDFIRNGRKILLRNDSMFSWIDPDDPGSRGEPEYPMEVPAGAGRIVGEIHIDHVRVNYQKNAFEYDTPDWQRVVRALRGEGPLLPKRAKEGETQVVSAPHAGGERRGER